MSPVRRQAQHPPAVPAVAALLTWFVPGAGHAYLGRYYVALAGFALVNGLYLLGFKFSDGLGFEFLQADLRTAMAPALTPEAGNLGALIWHRIEQNFVPQGSARPWPSTIQLGVLLTAVSGILNLCLISSAYYDAERRPTPRKPSPPTAVLLTWLVPGLGHWMCGRRLRALIVFVLLVGLFLLGTALADGANLDRERHFFYWGGQLFLGLPAILAELIHAHAPVTGDIQYVDAGLVFGCVAGLLNVLVMIDAYSIAEAREVESDEAAASSTPVEAGT